jgi:hypothetical protein
MSDMRVSCALPLLVFLLVLVGCSQRGFDPMAEEAKLLRRDTEWADLASAGKDVEKIVSYWSDDAVLIFPGQPVLEDKAAGMREQAAHRAAGMRGAQWRGAYHWPLMRFYCH